MNDSCSQTWQQADFSLGFLSAQLAEHPSASAVTTSAPMPAAVPVVSATAPISAAMTINPSAMPTFSAGMPPALSAEPTQAAPETNPADYVASTTAMNTGVWVIGGGALGGDAAIQAFAAQFSPTDICADVGSLSFGAHSASGSGSADSESVSGNGMAAEAKKTPWGIELAKCNAKFYAKECGRLWTLQRMCKESGKIGRNKDEHRYMINRKSAKVSRVRKREYVRQLEVVVKHGELHTKRLQNEVSAVHEETARLRAQMHYLEEALRQAQANRAGYCAETPMRYAVQEKGS